jgi:hypothetical protein
VDFDSGLFCSYHESLCNENKSYFEDTFPFCDEDKLELGTEIMKFGGQSGITFGRYAGKETFTFTDKSKTINCSNKIIVQWSPGARFFQGGDSGSIYYAIKGDLNTAFTSVLFAITLI